jgi:predicted nucleotidyltransferase
VFEELASILRKTSGLVDVLANALAPLVEKISVALVFGSMGSGKETSGSDVDVLIIGDLSFADAVAALYPAQTTLGREINPKIYGIAEWRELKDNKNAFVQEILRKPKLYIIGGINDID